MTASRHFRVKSFEIEAVQWDGAETTASSFLGDITWRRLIPEGLAIVIPTDQKDLVARLDDWIIRARDTGGLSIMTPEDLEKVFEPC